MSLVGKVPKVLPPGRMAELADRLGLDLADALAGDGEQLTDLLERVVHPLADAEAEAQHPLLPGRERGEHALGLVAKMGRLDGLRGPDRTRIGDEIPEQPVAVL